MLFKLRRRFRQQISYSFHCKKTKSVFLDHFHAKKIASAQIRCLSSIQFSLSHIWSPRSIVIESNREKMILSEEQNISRHEKLKRKFIYLWNLFFTTYVWDQIAVPILSRSQAYGGLLMFYFLNQAPAVNRQCGHRQKDPQTLVVKDVIYYHAYSSMIVLCGISIL